MFVTQTVYLCTNLEVKWNRLISLEVACFFLPVWCPSSVKVRFYDWQAGCNKTNDFNFGAWGFIGLDLFSVCTVTQWEIKMQTIQYRTSRIWEMKEDKYTKRLAKNQVCAKFQMRDILKNDLPKFVKLCMETPCWSPFQGHQYGRRIPTETSVFEFFY